MIPGGVLAAFSNWRPPQGWRPPDEILETLLGLCLNAPDTTGRGRAAPPSSNARAVKRRAAEAVDEHMHEYTFRYENPPREEP